MNIAVAKGLAGTVVVAVATAAVYFAVTSASRASLAAAEAELHRLRDDITQMTGRMAALEVRTGSGVPEGLIWSGQSKAEAELSVQSEVLARAESGQVTLASFGPAAGPNGIAHPTIAYRVEGSASWEDALGFFDGLRTAVRPLAISELSIRPVPPGDAAPGVARISFNAVLWGFLTTSGGGQ